MGVVLVVVHCLGEDCDPILNPGGAGPRPKGVTSYAKYIKETLLVSC
jgi:hypothetical protein